MIPGIMAIWWVEDEGREKKTKPSKHSRDIPHPEQLIRINIIRSFCNTILGITAIAYLVA